MMYDLIDSTPCRIFEHKEDPTFETDSWHVYSLEEAKKKLLDLGYTRESIDEHCYDDGEYGIVAHVHAMVKS